MSRLFGSKKTPTPTEGTGQKKGLLDRGSNNPFLIHWKMTLGAILGTTLLLAPMASGSYAKWQVDLAMDELKKSGLIVKQVDDVSQWRSSLVTYEISLPNEELGDLLDLPKIELTTNISHGPFHSDQFGEWVWGETFTTLWADGKPVFDKPVAIFSSPLGGDLRGVFKIPAFSQARDGTSVSFEGMTGILTPDEKGPSSLRFEMLGMTVKSNNVELTVGNAQSTLRLYETQNGLLIGDDVSSLAYIRVASGDELYAFNNIASMSSADLSNSNVDGRAKVTIEEITTPTSRYLDTELTVNMQRVYEPALANLMNILEKTQEQFGDKPEKFNEATLNALRGFGWQVFINDPSLSYDITTQSNHGEIAFHFEIATSGVDKTVRAAPMKYLEKLSSSGFLKVPQRILVDELLSVEARKKDAPGSPEQRVITQIKMLLNMNIMRKEGTDFVLSFSYKDQDATLNNKPFGLPLGMASAFAAEP